MVLIVGGLGAFLPTASARAADQDWTPPLSGRLLVLAGFEGSATPYGPGHRGVDLAASSGQPIRAAAAGTVTVAGPVAGRPLIVLAHGPARTDDELRTTYEAVDPTVRVGQLVERGQVIGTVSADPGHCPDRPCLHWGLRRGNDYLDPMTLLDPPRIRLLPVDATTALPGRAPGEAVDDVAQVPRSAAVPDELTGMTPDSTAGGAAPDIRTGGERSGDSGPGLVAASGVVDTDRAAGTTAGPIGTSGALAGAGLSALGGIAIGAAALAVGRRRRIGAGA